MKTIENGWFWLKNNRSVRLFKIYHNSNITLKSWVSINVPIERYIHKKSQRPFLTSNDLFDME